MTSDSRHKRTFREWFKDRASRTWDDVDFVEHVPARLRNVPPIVVEVAGAVVAIAMVVGFILYLSGAASERGPDREQPEERTERTE